MCGDISYWGYLGQPVKVMLQVSTDEAEIRERCLEKFPNLHQILKLRCRPDVKKPNISYYFFHNDQFITRTFNDTIDRDKSLLTGNYTCRMDSPCGTFYDSTIFTEGKTLHYDILIAFI